MEKDYFVQYFISWVKQRLLEGVDFLHSSPLEYMTHTVLIGPNINFDL